MAVVVSNREVLTPDEFPFAAKLRAEGKTWQQTAEGIGSACNAVGIAIRSARA